MYRSLHARPSLGSQELDAWSAESYGRTIATACEGEARRSGISDNVNEPACVHFSAVKSGLEDLE